MSETASQKTTAEVTALLKARCSLFWIVTTEEKRVERAIIDAAAAAKYETRLWDVVRGVSNESGTSVTEDGPDIGTTLAAIQAATSKSAWVLRDAPYWLKLDATALRSMRNLALDLSGSPIARAIFILTPSSEVPPELTDHAIVIKWPQYLKCKSAAVIVTAAKLSK